MIISRFLNIRLLRYHAKGSLHVELWPIDLAMVVRTNHSGHVNWRQKHQDNPRSTVVVDVTEMREMLAL